MSIVIAQCQWQCRSCDKQFDTRGKRDAHHRKEHQREIPKIGMMVESQGTKRGEGEKFPCRCGKDFWHAWSWQRHRKSCNALILTAEMADESPEQGQGMYQSPKRWQAKKVAISACELILFWR